ncbi:MAG: thermonuclease family protein [Phycisphaerae bacterium]|nr:thermonuclease family protein [Phycisphaerae bacterium]
MRKNIALVLCLSLLTAGVLFSSFRVIILSERVRELEQARHIEPTPKPQEQPAPLQKQPLSVKQRIAPPDNSLHKVIAVTDGDTIQIDTDTGPLKVRIVGIDTPETVHPFKPVQPFGPEASARAKELLQDKTVKIQYDPDPKHGKWGTYKRLLVYIELPDGRDFGLVMISEGLARAYPKYPFSRVEEYLEVEQKAKVSKAGIWQGQQPTTIPTTQPVSWIKPFRGLPTLSPGHDGNYYDNHKYDYGHYHTSHIPIGMFRQANSRGVLELKSARFRVEV